MATLAQSSFVKPPPAKTLRNFAWFVLGYNVLVVLWGSVVRATGSGAGCGNHWPLCNGEVIPQSPKVATVIEFTHRAMTGGTTFLILGLLIWTLRATPRGHLARIAAISSTILLINEAFLGALLVKLGYVVRDQSLGRFIVLPIHLANTLLLLAALALTASFLARNLTRSSTRISRRLLLVSLFGLGASILVGVSGSLAALGDTLFPSTSLGNAIAQDLASTSSWLIRLRWIHPASALVAAGFVLFLVSRALAGPSRLLRRLAIATAVLLLSQIAIGFVDVLLLAPTWMQIFHLLGADLYWISLVLLTSRVVLAAGQRISTPAEV